MRGDALTNMPTADEGVNNSLSVLFLMSNLQYLLYSIDIISLLGDVWAEDLLLGENEIFKERLASVTSLFRKS